MPTAFPFSAIVAQEEMKLAFLIAAVDQTVGGVLVFGDRGTGKSTAVRSLAALLPKMQVIAGCPYGCDPEGGRTRCADGCGGRAAKGVTKTRAVPVPVIDLPLGVTEDRVVGALDLERALAHGVKAFEPGLLARAHRGFLYIDEVNLLEDHIVDLLLDVAASGENVVEREGLSIRHAARFVLVGTGNPEEGELRPQLLDRFGLSVEVKTPNDVETRVEVVRRRDAFDRDPKAFAQKWKTRGRQGAQAHRCRTGTPRRGDRPRLRLGEGGRALHAPRRRRPSGRADLDPCGARAGEPRRLGNGHRCAVAPRRAQRIAPSPAPQSAR